MRVKRVEMEVGRDYKKGQAVQRGDAELFS